MSVIVLITLRIASLTNSGDRRTEAFEILRKCRLILSNWIEGLESVLESTADWDRIQRIQQNLLVCVHGSYLSVVTTISRSIFQGVGNIPTPTQERILIVAP